MGIGRGPGTGLIVGMCEAGNSLQVAKIGMSVVLCSKNLGYLIDKENCVARGTTLKALRGIESYLPALLL